MNESALNWADFWHYDDNGKMICNNCGEEVWYLNGGYICSSKATCFNEDDNECPEG